MIIFLYGENTFLSRKKLIELKEKFLREVDPTGDSLHFLDGENVDLNKINQTISTQSLFVKKRMVVIRNIFSNKSKTIFETLLEFVKKIEEKNDNIIIFIDDSSGGKLKTNKFFKFLSSLKFSQEFKVFSNTETAKWIREEVLKKGGQITQQNAAYLISLLGIDLWRLENEIIKLLNHKRALQKKENVEIEISDIKTQCRGQADENIFALTDAISNKNKSLALQLFENELEAGVTDVYLLHMLARQFKILAQVRQALDLGYSLRKITSELKLHPFVAQKASTQVNNFTLPVLKNALGAITEIDYNLKQGQADIKNALTLLIAKL